MKLLKATIVRQDHGPDHVSIATDLPESTWPYTSNLDLTFNVARGQAEAYLQRHFSDLPVALVAQLYCDCCEQPISEQDIEKCPHCGIVWAKEAKDVSL